MSDMVELANMTPTDHQVAQSQTDKINSQNQIIQTENASVDLQAAQSQTEAVHGQNQLSQTDKVPQQHSVMQTTNIDTQHSSMQTTPKVEHQKGQQTERRELSHIHSQTDEKVLTISGSQTELLVRVVPDSTEVNLQAGSWNPIDNVCQTNQSMSLMTEGGSQTILEQATNQCQTDPTLTEEQEIQTILETAETSAQAVVDDREMACQAVVEDAVVDTQTDISCFNMVEGSAQAVVEVGEQHCQATVECYVQEIQTNSSMALLVDTDAQATVEITEQTMQTDIRELNEQYMQTELEIDQKSIQTENESMDNDCQTNVDVAEIETQTEVEINEEVNANDASFMEDSQGLSQGSSVLQPLSGNAEPREFSEEGCQTEPVTIIIGDASFLVKKLKMAALSPTKVSSMGNEIEIELRGDDDDDDGAAYDSPERELVRQSPLTPQARNAPGVNRTRGVRTRGGGYRGSPRGGHSQVNYQQPRSTTSGPYYATSAGGQGKYSCPVCSDTFHESPALYEHLQNVHREAFSLIKKPRGREGKTIVMKQATGPPILTPMPVPQPPHIVQQQRLQQQRLHQLQQLQREQLEQQQLQEQQLQQQQLQEEQLQAEQLQQQQLQQEQQQLEEQQLQQQQFEEQQIQEQMLLQQQEVQQVDEQHVEQDGVAHQVEYTELVTEQVIQEVPEIGLFEEPGVWTPNTNRKRTLARRQITDDEIATDPNQEQYQIVIQPTGEGDSIPEDEVGSKRKRLDTDEGGSKRMMSDEDNTEEDDHDDEPSPKRKSIRAIKTEKTDSNDDVSTPRPRGRPRTRKR